jgi:ribosomal protein S27AE
MVQEYTKMILQQMRRGVGYCTNIKCDEHAKACFLLNHGDKYTCGVCNKVGLYIEEKGTFEGKSEHWKEVRVEFDYDPLQGIYRSVAIIIDNSLVGSHNVYTLRSPLIRTDKRASKVAENLLATLQAFKEIEEDCIPRAMPKDVHFDASLEEVKRELDIISKSWEGLKTG